MLLLPKYQHAHRYLSSNLQTKAEIQKYYGFAQTLRGWAQEESDGALYMSYLYGSLFDQSYGKISLRFLFTCPVIHLSRVPHL